MVLFLTQIDIFLKISNNNLEFLASKVMVRKCKKGEMILTKEDFPLSQFFVVKTGKVQLMKKVEVERANFMPTTKVDYQKRSYKKSVLHSLGIVHPGQYYGVIESLMGMNSGQVICCYASAAEDTELVYFNKIDFVNGFEKDQIGEMLDVVKAQVLFKDIPNEELILRTMHRDKVLQMCMPRERVFMDRDTPRRIKKIIMHHQAENQMKSNPKDDQVQEKKDPSAVKELRKRNMVVSRDKYGHPVVKRAKITQDDADRLVRVNRGDFQTNQQFIRE